MDALTLITDALTYIELNLTEEITTEDIAGALYCSRSSLEKHFRYLTDMSIREYCIRRRMTKAAKEIADSPETSFLDIAVKYGYGSHEAFTRAFRQVWHLSPSEYRRNPVRFALFPALRLEKEIMEDTTMRQKRKIDISELYDCIRARRNCFIIGADIKSLIPINEISLEAGDTAILTALKRLEDAAGEDDIVFRIGGDEFILLTASSDEAYAKSIADGILARNGESFRFRDRDIPLHLFITCFRMQDKPLRYAELFTAMQKKLDEAK